MNANTTTLITTTVNPLINIQNLLTQYTFTMIFLLGNFSNLSNIVVFLQKSLRSNACSWYFALVSLGHLVFLYFSCLTRIITAWSDYDLTRISIIYCRIRIYFLAISLLIARYFLCFISIDRWMITSTKNSIRRLNSLKIARWFIIFGINFCLIFSINFPIWYRIEEIKGCIGEINTFYPLFYTIYNLIITIAPFFIMILFSLLVLKNLRQRQIASTVQIHVTIQSINIRQQFQRKDLQFIKLSLIQVFIYILFNTFYAYNATYTFITQSMIKSSDRAILDSFLSTIGLIISYLYMAITFFLYTTVSRTFRKECILAVKRIRRWIF